jgi:hypothetical protein
MGVEGERSLPRLLLLSSAKPSCQIPMRGLTQRGSQQTGREYRMVLSVPANVQWTLAREVRRLLQGKIFDPYQISRLSSHLQAREAYSPQVLTGLLSCQIGTSGCFHRQPADE